MGLALVGKLHTELLEFEFPGLVGKLGLPDTVAGTASDTVETFLVGHLSLQMAHGHLLRLYLHFQVGDICGVVEACLLNLVAFHAYLI